MENPAKSPGNDSLDLTATTATMGEIMDTLKLVADTDDFSNVVALGYCALEIWIIRAILMKLTWYG